MTIATVESTFPPDGPSVSSDWEDVVLSSSCSSIVVSVLSVSVVDDSGVDSSVVVEESFDSVVVDDSFDSVYKAAIKQAKKIEPDFEVLD